MYKVNVKLTETEATFQTINFPVISESQTYTRLGDDIAWVLFPNHTFLYAYCEEQKAPLNPYKNDGQ